MYLIWRHQYNITLNDKEYILDEDNMVMLFESEQEAVDYLNEKNDLDYTKDQYEQEGVYIDRHSNHI